jgi:hypothetical protein
MAGTYVTDATALKLLNALDATADADGSSFAATALVKGRPYQAKLTLAAVTGTNPELIVEIQGSDSSSHASGVYSYGAFGTIVAADAQGTKWLTFVPQHDYLRAVVRVDGTSTPTFNDVTVTIEEINYFRTATSSSA